MMLEVIYHELFKVPIDAMVCGTRKIGFVFSKSVQTHRLYAYYERFQKLNAG